MELSTLSIFFHDSYRDAPSLPRSVDPPIKQGQTRYPFLVLQFDKDEEMSVHLNISEEDLEKEYEGKLQAEMSGPTYEVISRVFKSLIKRKITVPGTFMGASGRD